jgi:hypothetical protein
MDEPRISKVTGEPVKVYRQFVKRGRTPEEKLAAQVAIRAAQDARRKANEEARRERVRLKREARLEVEKAVKKGMEKLAKEPDPENTPERQAKRKAERVAKGKAKGREILPGRERHGSIDATDVAIILALKEKEATNKEIAQALNIGPDTVARVLIEFTDSRAVAKAYLKSKADQIARDAVDASHIAAGSGKGEVSLELLDRLDVAPKRLEDTNSNKTLIIVGSANQSALPSFPSIETQRLTE